MGNIYTLEDVESVQSYLSSILCDMFRRADLPDSEWLIIVNASLNEPAKSMISASSLSFGLHCSV
jgi:hypothetical protein